MTSYSAEERDYLLLKLVPFLTEHKQQLFQKILNYRTRHFVVAAEDISHERNAGAMMRTCDCFGIQDFHLIENNHSKKATHFMAKGAEKWISKSVYDRDEESALKCISALKANGYRIVATTPHAQQNALQDFDISSKAAFFFGSEDPGVSHLVEENADEFLTVPIYGFTESYNVSVATALILQHVTRKLHLSDVSWQLTENEKQDLLLEWTMKSVRSSELLVKRFLAERTQTN